MASESIVIYRAGHCGVCEHRLVDVDMNEVQLHILAPAGIVNVRCCICSQCRPTPATVGLTTAWLVERILRWYGSTPAAWPAQRLLARA